MMRKHLNRMCCVLATGALLLAASGAVAGISSIVFRIDATSTSGSDSWTVPASQLVPIDPNNLQWGYTWTLTSPHQLKFGGGPTDIIATLYSANITYLVDDNLNYPGVAMDFKVCAGASDVTIEVHSALVTTLLPDAQALATTAFSLTDTVNDGRDAHIGALAPHPGMFEAWYNGSTTFTSLVPWWTVGGGSSQSTGTYSSDPNNFSFLPVGTDIHDMSVYYGFSLTAKDMVTGTNTYFAFPEPASFALLALVGVLRRR